MGARTVLEVWAGNATFMPWNLTLAFVPVVIGVFLFRRRTTSPLWWLGLAAFLAFLPNAPYVLSDVIHLADDVRATRSDAVVVAGVLGQYAAFFLAGLLAYVVALGELTRWLAARGWDRLRVTGVELAAHAACAVGVYLGRVPRFNSWDLVTRPDAVAATAADHLSDRYPLALVLATFVVLVVSTAVLQALLDDLRSAVGRLRLRLAAPSSSSWAFLELDAADSASACGVASRSGWPVSTEARAELPTSSSSSSH